MVGSPNTNHQKKIMAIAVSMKNCQNWKISELEIVGGELDLSGSADVHVSDSTFFSSPRAVAVELGGAKNCSVKRSKFRGFQTNTGVSLDEGVDIELSSNCFVNVSTAVKAKNFINFSAWNNVDACSSVKLQSSTLGIHRWLSPFAVSVCMKKLREYYGDVRS